ncbi:hypothetical protein GCM10010869_28170 [Mesorhizobium tianshanense]|nr:hypothetical protein GCM10010869_28170 [Mesorhizobium tianshanense]
MSHGLTAQKLPGVISAIRSTNSLRPLRPLETGRSIADSPAGTFFYVSAYHINFRAREPFPLDRGKIGQALPVTGLFYEFQHRSNGKLYLIAFASETEADRLRGLGGDQEFRATLS